MQKFINSSLLLILSCLATSIGAQDLFFEKHFDWTTKLKNYRLDLKPRKNLKTQVAFCFRPQKNDSENKLVETDTLTQSVNLHEPLRIASISKLYTSMWALGVKGSDYRFKTFVKYDETSSSLFLWGFDPLFSVEHVFNIIKSLNDRDIKKIDKLVVSDQLTIVKKNQEFVREYRLNTVEDDFKRRWSRSLFKRAFITAHRYHGTEKRHYLKFAPQDAIKFKNLNLALSKIEIKSSRFFKNLEPEMTLKSRSLPHYLKIMNTESYNKLADLLFENLGGESAFKDYLTSIYGEKSALTQLYTGSGLNKDVGSKRYDNISTCDTVLFVLDQLRTQLESKKNKSLRDILAFAGNNEGTLEKRFKHTKTYNHSVLKPYVAAKTGSLYQRPTSAIAGVLGQKAGEEQVFAILTEYRPLYWRNKKGELRRSYPKVKRFEEEILDSLRSYLDIEELDIPLSPVTSSLQEITETLSVIDK